MSSTHHLTTAIPYVNGRPHLGHVLEWFQADALAKFWKLQGADVSFTSGTDENSLKNVQAAEKASQEVQAWLDQYAQIFQDAYDAFGIELTGFRRGSDQDKHWPGVQDLWTNCFQNGDIYKKEYQGLYCVGCESFYTESELKDGKCPEHLVEPELISEENYFFKLSKYESQIQELIVSNKLRIFSEQFKNEMLGFIDQGLEDFSVSRSLERARGVGVPVPNDESQVMYVWFDALQIYMTAVGFGYDQALWEKYWNQADQITHVIGKGINRFHSIYWIGMLLSAGIRLPDVVSVHGYITAEGQKMSKSLGNVIDPFELVEQYGLEPVRYYLLKEIPTHSDGDFSESRFIELYTADLANGIGNVCSRVAKLCHKSGAMFGAQKPTRFDPAYVDLFTATEVSQAGLWVTEQVADIDQFLSQTRPWTLEGEEQTKVLEQAVQAIVNVSFHLQPFLPTTATTILNHFTQEKISALKPLFPRLS